MYDFEQLDSYELLGVARNASAEDLKRAYRQAIAQYHPDKWSKADASAQEYARKRAAAITEAYSLLKDKTPRLAATVEPIVPENRAERLAQLYAHGQSLLAAGKYAQAVIVLQQLQQADPFYRDSADLLQRAESAIKRAQPARQKKQKLPKTLIVGIGSTLGIAALGGAIWLLGGSETSVAENRPTTPAVAIADQTATPPLQGAPLSTATAVPPTAVPPTDGPTAVPPTAVPPTAVPPTAVPPTAVPPTAVPTAPPPLPDDLSGPVLLSDDMNGGSWPVGDSGNWSFSFVDGRYRMTMKAGLGTVWSYGGTLPGTNVVLAADVETRSGSAGLLFGFVDANNYYRLMLGADGTWALQQRTGSGINLLLSGTGLGPGRMIVAQRGAVTHVYWNETYLGEAILPAFPAGNYGFILASNDASEGYFDNLRIRQLP